MSVDETISAYVLRKLNLAPLTGEYLRDMSDLARRAKAQSKSILMWMAL